MKRRRRSLFNWSSSLRLRTRWSSTYDSLSRNRDYPLDLSREKFRRRTNAGFASGPNSNARWSRA